MKHFNREYAGGIPIAAGDRIYSQDLFREFWYLEDAANRAIADSWNGGDGRPVILNGCGFYQLTTGYISLQAGTILVPYSVTIPLNYGTFPPVTTSVDVWTKVNYPGVVDSVLGAAVLDGVTLNYVKISYKETDGNTRARAKASGTYAYEKVKSHELTIDSTPPTAYQACICICTISAGGVITFNPYYTRMSGAYRYPQRATLPVGSILSAAINIPGNISSFAGFLFCDGAELSRSTYLDLFTAVGTAFGIGNGSTTFNIPDLRGRFIRGHDPYHVHDTEYLSRVPMGDGNPYDMGSLQPDDFKSHSHGLTDPGHLHAMVTHGHGVTDPGHAHGAVDVAHASLYAQQSGGGGTGLTTGTEQRIDLRTIDTSSVGAGISVNQGGTPQTNSYTTQMTVNTAGGVETRPSNVNIGYFIKW